MIRLNVLSSQFKRLKPSKQTLVWGSTALVAGSLALYLMACNRTEEGQPATAQQQDSLSAPSGVDPSAQDISDAMLTCSYNGDEWTAASDKSNRSINPILNAELRKVDGKDALFLTGWRVRNKEVTSISIFLNNFNGTGEYQLNNGDPGRATFSKEFVGTQGKAKSIFYPTDKEHTGTLAITSFDTSTHKVAGTFSFEPNSKQESTSIKDGTFHLKYTEEKE